jgi:hypothetical protein
MFLSHSSSFLLDNDIDQMSDPLELKYFVQKFKKSILNWSNLIPSRSTEIGSKPH